MLISFSSSVILLILHAINYLIHKHVYSDDVTVDLLQMLEMNVTVAFPAAPLLTVILALVGKYSCT